MLPASSPSLSSAIRRADDVVGLAGAEQRHLRHLDDVVRHHQLGGARFPAISAQRFRVGLCRGGDQHDSFAPPLVGNGNGRMVLFRPQRLHQHLDRAERHHLAGDLGEALGPAADRR